MVLGRGSGKGVGDLLVSLGTFRGVGNGEVVRCWVE